jgi:hypothetical protein
MQVYDDMAVHLSAVHLAGCVSKSYICGMSGAELKHQWVRLAIAHLTVRAVLGPIEHAQNI